MSTSSSEFPSIHSVYFSTTSSGFYVQVVGLNHEQKEVVYKSLLGDSRYTMPVSKFNEQFKLWKLYP